MITVGLPVYNQTAVLPVALLGLSNQELAGEWELIVSSEDDVWDVVSEYEHRLFAAGCVRVTEDRLRGWIPLPQKWRRIGQMMHHNSVGMFLQDADCYSHPHRIRQSREAMENGYDWYHEQKGYFYDIHSGQIVLFDGSTNRKGKTCLNMCIAANHARKLPVSNARRGVNGWMFKTIENPRVYLYKKIPKGIDFHGANTISFKRGGMIKKLRHPFIKTDVKVNKILDNWNEVKILLITCL